MKLFGRAAISEFLGDRILYRNLIPADPRLPGLPELRKDLGIAPHTTPRKTTMDYARVIQAVLDYAQNLRTSRPLERLVYIGDTRMNDGTAFANIAAAGKWPGMAFIGSEKIGPLSFNPEELEAGPLYTASRWTALEQFANELRDARFAVDDTTAVLIDMDKTALGARGRNDRLIDQARLEAARITAREVLGEDTDLTAFQKVYDTLNQPEFHPLTADNQDYLVYICLTLSGGWINLDHLLEWYYGKKVTTFDQFVEQTEHDQALFPEGTCQMHGHFYESYTHGDPTPFKAFRQSEYRATIQRLGHLPDDTLPETMLKEEIVLTQEVRQIALQWQDQGALLFGISDKPDEASLPSAEQAAAGMRPIHQTETHILGA
jgi:hypothetical protein